MIGIAAGPFGNPNRCYGPNDGQGDVGNPNRELLGAWERPISVFYFDYSTICQGKADFPDQSEEYYSQFGCFRNLIYTFLQSSIPSQSFSQVDTAQFSDVRWAFTRCQLGKFELCRSDIA